MGKRPKYHFNSELLRFERIQRTTLDWLKSFLFHAFTGLSMGLVFFFIYLTFFDTPLTKRLREENEELKVQYRLLQKQSDRVKEVLVDLQQRDNNLYRAILEAEPIPANVREGEFAGTNRYASFAKMNNSELLKSTTQQIDGLSKMAYVQSKSYDELLKLVKNKEVRLLCLPAIQPVLNRDLTRTASGYGPRFDPIYHVPTFHYGMDFTSPTGTHVYATGEGTVILAGWKRGFGNAIIINHGYNYQTLYGHLSSIKVRVGQRVRRGDIIGGVGSTGKSTGPHLHYEVHYQGKPVNPTNYYYLDLSPEEYDKMIQISSNFGQTMD
ncbi:MAG: peptidoglycan DD-metalloendopeptidase family protein [Bacteroidota bacterium]|nr:peptidoglycan DD-metalloendopeptidase family protein [Bacteroidota bacterium]